ncbi:hypothetical protein ABEB36_000953 [Hypothenemus hampei]|uniref:DNA/RNA non-specific endonuclease/pyrophosphatase/phosphodiesterase domain-containing protein n=1 Tax=Hypothenemus hampei TaxID=57062 RepID=A0ABD1FD28_HYPHA
MEVILLFSSLFSVIVTSASINSECILNVTNPDYERKLPLPLYNSSSNYELATPHQGLIRLQTGQNISFLCSGIRNYVRQTNANVSTVTCIGDDQVKLFRMVFHIAEISCKNSVRGNVRATQEKCANNQGLVYQIGYQVTRTEWFTLITVCYIPSNGQTLYTRHILYGKEIKYRSKTKYRPDFSSSGQNDQITASLSYNQTFQKLVFNRILKSSLLARKFINDKSFLARGHLSPDADFLLAPTQFSTYFYINTAPQWQRINSANWKSVEITTRDLAVHYGDLDIITGTHDILTYLDQENNFQKIYLGNE